MSLKERAGSSPQAICRVLGDLSECGKRRATAAESARVLAPVHPPARLRSDRLRSSPFCCPLALPRGLLMPILLQGRNTVAS